MIENSLHCLGTGELYFSMIFCSIYDFVEKRLPGHRECNLIIYLNEREYHHTR